MSDSTILLIAALSGLCPLSLLVGLLAAYIIGMQTGILVEWEYLEIPSLEPRDVSKIINPLSQGGWEVINSFRDADRGGTITVMLKRKRRRLL